VVAKYGDSCSASWNVIQHNIQQCNADKIFPVNIIQSNHDINMNAYDCSRLSVTSWKVHQDQIVKESWMINHLDVNRCYHQDSTVKQWRCSDTYMLFSPVEQLPLYVDTVSLKSPNRTTIQSVPSSKLQYVAKIVTPTVYFQAYNWSIQMAQN
jgi:hypothetical protein